MTALTPHFTWDEVTRSPTAAAKGINNDLPTDLIPNVQKTAAGTEQARAILGVPMRVTSWYRCPMLNAAVGGASTSKHMQGLAIDFQPVGMDREAAFEKLIKSTRPWLPFDQLIEEQTKDGAQWIHLGFTTGTPRREVLRARGDALGSAMHYTREIMG